MAYKSCRESLLGGLVASVGGPIKDVVDSLSAGDRASVEDY